MRRGACENWSPPWPHPTYGDAALDHLTRMYGETIPARNLHLVMGTMLAHPRTFIVIGLLRSGLDPQELAKRQSLF